MKPIPYTTCPYCGKRSYESRKEARLSASRVHPRHSGHASVYRCLYDKTRWHWGHLHAATRRGIEYA
ncbi:hypothetical protein Wildcat_6 [Mycobacterium phage Wildcat]|uniref:Uncharacterized protein n=3 Tax=Mycobacterium virus Wildcat TaxID=1993859 RepID=Q19Y54_9CAUD|nr:hypothetical protein Wildcat_6 [Mycobacterium phage Wildcat]ABE67611.1 hypothetical protein Wildcat_6 [Mycobacterium phage Wildcat]AJD82078.1 hypothetical protein COSMO_6 [Mycobacterium phage Cosmo]QGJ90030.1 hypothetical protein PBI_MARYV_6 [Mycobacterium phage MaryV]WKR36019.1 hypothetical protein [Mycobacterium phage Azrael100]